MIISGGMIGIPGGFVPPTKPFNGNFASLFSNVLQSVQTDLGFTYGTTMLATTGNTSTTGITISGTLNAGLNPPPITVQCTTGGTVGPSGASFSIFVGSDPFAGITPSVGTPVALSSVGPSGAGLSITWSAGSGVTNDSWKATCAGLADQSGNALHYTQVTAANQPIVTTGLNGFAGIQYDVNARILTSTLVLPAPATTPTFRWAVFRQLSWGAATYIFGDSSGRMALKQAIATPELALSSTGNGCLNSGATISQWVRAECWYTGSASDYLKVGSTTASDALAGNLASAAGMQIGIAQAQNLQREMLAVVYTSSLPTPAVLAAANAAVASKYAGLVAT